MLKRIYSLNYLIVIKKYLVISLLILHKIQIQNFLYNHKKVYYNQKLKMEH